MRRLLAAAIDRAGRCASDPRHARMKERSI
jgi:hypothetical protein